MVCQWWGLCQWQPARHVTVTPGRTPGPGPPAQPEANGREPLPVPVGEAAPCQCRSDALSTGTTQPETCRPCHHREAA